MKAAAAFEQGLVDHLVSGPEELADAARSVIAGTISRRPRPSDEGFAEMIAEERAALSVRTTRKTCLPLLPFSIITHWKI